MKKHICLLALLVGISLVSNGQVERTIMIETFTSSTCPPCNPGNSNLEGILSDPVNEDRFVSLKYQMDWPGTGDPYFTAEGNSRRTFYAVGSVPNTRIDAAFGGNTNDLLQSDLNVQYAIDPGAEIVAYYQVTGQTVDVQVDIEALVDLPSSVRLFIAIFEYTTDNNVKTNGETEFYHVMKKMLPNSSGTSVSSCLIGDSVHVEKSHTFVGSYVLPPDANSPINHSVEHSVEEFDDLGVAVWLQRTTTKEVYQATYAIKGMLGEEEVSAVVPFVKVYPNPANETAAVAFDLSAPQSSVGIDVYNSEGKLVQHQDLIDLPAGRSVVDLSTASLNNGLYLVRIQSATGGQYTEGFSVQH